MEITIILILIWIHWVADFVLQSDMMAQNKNKNNYWLVFHAFVYGICFLGVGFIFSFIIFMSHFAIDFVTSRVNSKLYNKNKIHYFFTSIGFDQALHITILITLYQYLN